jgi:SPP1 gp7 family putative phage head morphogenesis protein
VALTARQKAAIKSELKRRGKKQQAGTGVDSPVALELYYFRELNRLVRAMNEAVFNILEPKINKEFLSDAKDPIIDAINDLQQRFSMVGIAQNIATDVVDKGDRFNRKMFVRQVNKAVGVNVNNILTDKGLKKLLDERIAANVRLIKTIPKQHFTRIRLAIIQGRRADDTAFSIKKDLKKIGKITRNRSKLIARDQVSKLNGALNELRQQDIGVSQYTWRTSEDERVRSRHKDNNGKTFRWDKPPKTGHPATEVNCRCTADPDFSFLKGL